MTAFLLVTYAETLTENVEGLTILNGFDAKLQMKKLIKSNQQCHPRPRLRRVLSFKPSTLVFHLKRVRLYIQLSR